MSIVPRLIAANGSSGGGGGGTDSYWSSVVYMSNTGSTTDLSTASTTATATSITSDSSRYPISGSSMLFNGSSSKVILGTTAQIASEDFTVDGWIYPTSYTEFKQIWSQYDGSGSGDFSNRTILGILSTGKIYFQRGTVAINGTTTITQNAWHFVEVTRSANTVYVFLDGALETSSALFGSMGNFAPGIGGASGSVTGNPHFAGNMSPIRITKGAARNTSAYSIPTQLFPTS